ncbi:MAG TPA: tRNA epoxyqueuosine(34) reductase QueG [Candidatus Eisenbacteria bacterium]|nr:tRNA epoxyqueuosine(34) reductase QueG [Candidatus Eisenbacteria bacterium]
MATALREASRALGFDAIGFARASEHPHAERLAAWLAEGRHATMRWMARDPDRRADPRRVLPGALSVVSVLASYYRGDWPEDASAAGRAPALRGRVARYAWGRDYHGRLKRRLNRLGRLLESLRPGAQWRAYVDSGPVLERGWAERAGLGWIGKNGNLIRQSSGSWHFIGEIVCDVALPEGEPARNRCGRCARCMPACPTGAIVGPYQVDARRCISYLTIEHEGAIPREMRAAVGVRIFGCDDCQEACPWNRFATPTYEADFAERPRQQTPWLIPLLAIDREGFAARYEGTALMRAGRDRFVRNVAVALGNLGDRRAVSPLAKALRDEATAAGRGHAAWALGRIGGPAAARALAAARERERDHGVREEIDAALAETAPAETE